MSSHNSSASPTSKGVITILLLLLILVVYALDSNPPEINDEQAASIVRRAKEGDDESFMALFALYYLPICRHIYRLIGNAEDAEDLALETFTRAWYRLPHIQDEKHFRGWLYKIATNVARDYLRTKNTLRHSPEFGERLSEDYTTELPTRFEDQVEDQELIRLAMEEVAPKQRICLVLYQEGFRLEEIAEFTGMRKRSVATYLSMAREQFRKAYRRLIIASEE